MEDLYFDFRFIRMLNGIGYYKSDCLHQESFFFCLDAKETKDQA